MLNRCFVPGSLELTISLIAREAPSPASHCKLQCSFCILRLRKVPPDIPVTPRNSGELQSNERTHLHDRSYPQRRYSIKFVYRNSLPPYIYGITPVPITMSRNIQASKRSASAAGVLGDISGNERRIRHSLDKGKGMEVDRASGKHHDAE